ncbi:alpha/beta fold hydrolase [Porticoccaceae bacterium LTM1]|nr:alpha/beta fold hydrolase [Porticoccaceae bacterium LTM1]
MPNSVQLHSQITGQGDKHVILVHGLFGMSDNLMALAKVLEDTYHVHRLDLRNHGRSERSDSMVLTDMAADIARYMEQQQIAKAVLFGHSLGGKVAMQLALEHHPALIGFVIADIAPVQYESRHNDVFKALNAIDLSAIKSRNDADQVMAEYVSETSLRQFLLKNLYRSENREFAWKINLPVLTERYSEALKPPQGEPCQMPTLFIKGEKSDYITTEHTEVIKRLFPNLHFKMISDTGHWLHAEKPELFNRIVRRFIDEQISW